MISNIKLDECFSIDQFFIKGFCTPSRLDRNCHRDGMPLYIREDILSKLLSIEENGIGFFIEVSLRNKKKWLLNCSYNPYKALIGSHMTTSSQSTVLYTSKYERLLFSGDFNTWIENTSVKIFYNSYNLTSM